MFFALEGTFFPQFLGSCWAQTAGHCLSTSDLPPKSIHSAHLSPRGPSAGDRDESGRDGATVLLEPQRCHVLLDAWPKTKQLE